MAELKVASANAEDVFDDIVRVNETHRRMQNSTRIRSAEVCKIIANNRSAYVVVRGLPISEGATIRMDEYVRDRLKVDLQKSYDFRFVKAGLWGQMVWSWQATSPAYRVASRLSVISLFLGVVGLLLGLMSLKG